MALLDLLGRRWTLRVLWELRDGPLQFRALQQRCGGMSSSVLNDRLGELRGAGIVEHGEGGYGLTDEGRDSSRSSSRCRPGRIAGRPARSDLDHQRDRAVVDELDGHRRTEHPLARSARAQKRS